MIIHDYYLLELHDVGMKEAAVVDDLTLNIHACKPLSSLKEFDGNLKLSITLSDSLAK